MSTRKRFEAFKRIQERELVSLRHGMSLLRKDMTSEIEGLFHKIEINRLLSKDKE